MMMSIKHGVRCTWISRTQIGDIPVKVCGKALNGDPLLGETYIVEPERPIGGYPYTHCCAFERDLVPEMCE